MRVACIWFDKPAPTAVLAELFLRFSPQIAIIEDKAIFVEIGKCQKLYSEKSFYARAHILLSRTGHTARITFGNDVTDSLVFAKYKTNLFDQIPLTALVDLVDPFSRDLMLKKSVFKIIDTFQDLGVSNLGAFKKLSVGDLIARFGVVGRFVHGRAHMNDFLSWPQFAPLEVICEKKDFPYFEFYGELDPILFELKSQLDRIFARLFARKKRLIKLQVQINCEKLSVHPDFIRKLDFEFFAPQSSVKGTLRILKERLSREFEKKPVLSPIEGIKTTVLKAVDFEGGQKNIFNEDEEKSEQLASIHNQLVEMLGKENVYQVELTQDRRPEKSWRKKFDTPHMKSAAPTDFTDLLPDRLTYICRYPLKVDIAAGFIYIQKKRYKILNWDNEIERMVGGWFEKPADEIKNTFERIYSLVEIEKHQKLSIFQTPNREFYIHSYSG